MAAELTAAAVMGAAAGFVTLNELLGGIVEGVLLFFRGKAVMTK